MQVTLVEKRPRADVSKLPVPFLSGRIVNQMTEAAQRKKKKKMHLDILVSVFLRTQ